MQTSKEGKQLLVLPAAKPMNYNHQHGRTAIGRNSGTHVLVVTNGNLTGLNRREVTSSTRNLAGLQGLVKS